MSTEAKCPFNHAAGGGTSNRDWWPNQLKVELLNQHSSKSDPMVINSPSTIDISILFISTERWFYP